MDGWLTWFAISLALLTFSASAVLIWFVLRLCKGLIESMKPVMLEQLRLVDKATTLAAAADVQAYQGIQVMDQQVVGYTGETYDPSDEAEARREAERHNEDPEELSYAQQEQLRDFLA